MARNAAKDCKLTWGLQNPGMGGTLITEQHYDGTSGRGGRDTGTLHKPRDKKIRVMHAGHVLLGSKIT